MAFHCPRCDGRTGVYSTIAEVRLRKCRSCGHAFRTEEIELDIPIHHKPRKAKPCPPHPSKNPPPKSPSTSGPRTSNGSNPPTAQAGPECSARR